MEKILVTGAAGFIGSHVVHKLLARDFRVGALVRPGSDAVRLAGLKSNPGLTLLWADMASGAGLAAALDGFDPHAVIHLAAAGVRGHVGFGEMIRVNVAGLAGLLEWPGMKGKRLVAAGSVFEYGACNGDISEETPCRPLDEYGLSKLKASELLFRCKDVEWILLRIFGAYGPGEQPGRLAPALVSALSEGQEVQLSEGGQVRDFTFVEDVAEAFVKALDTPRVVREAINIGTGRPLTVREFAEKGAALAGSICGIPDPEALLCFGKVARSEKEAPRLVAETGNAKDLLGWEATTMVEDGLGKCFEWYRSVPDNTWRAGSAGDPSGVGDGEVRFSLVMPCYNEERSLPESIPPLVEILERQGLSFEIVLVNNGSFDGTGRVIDELMGRGMPVKRIDVDRNLGYGFGITSGLKEARGRFVGFMCADGQVAPEDVARALWAVERAGPDALVKVRRVTRNDGLFRWLQSRVFNLVCLLLFRTLTTDVNGTPKLMERRVWERMKLESRDWFVDAEVVFKAKKMGLNFLEVPVDFMPRQEGRSWVNLGTTAEFARNLLKALFRGWS